jgi:hypothetical protein
MEKEKTHFVKQVFDYLYPSKNRVVAAVAFVRTFKQTLTGAFTVGGTGLIAINASDISNLDWTVVGWTVVAVLLSAFLSAGVAFDDVSRNGLNSKYMDAATAPAVTIKPEDVARVGNQLLKRPASFVPASETEAVQIGVPHAAAIEEPTEEVVAEVVEEKPAATA